MKKTVKVCLWILVVLAVLLVLTIGFLDRVILHGFNTAAPTALGVPATLGDAQVRLLRGYTSLRDLHIGNPEGFKTDGLFDLAEVTLRVDRGSILTDTVVINEILIKGMEVTYEKGLLTSNVGALLDQLAGDDDADADAKKEEAAKEEAEAKDKADKGGKKLIIKKLDIVDSKANLTITAAMGHVIPIPLPDIHLTDIGQESGGASVGETIQSVLSAIFSTVESAISGAGDLIGGAAGAVGDGAAAVAGAVGDGAAAAAGALGDGTAAVAGAVGDGAAAAAGALGDGATAAGQAVAAGASAATEGTVEGVKAVGRFLNPFDSPQDEKTAPADDATP